MKQKKKSHRNYKKKTVGTKLITYTKKLKLKIKNVLNFLIGITFIQVTYIEKLHMAISCKGEHNKGQKKQGLYRN